MDWLTNLLKQILGVTIIDSSGTRAEGGLWGPGGRFGPPLDPRGSPLPSSTTTASPSMPTPTPTPTPLPYFGEGNEVANVEPTLFDVLLALKASEEERRNIAELSGQESSYGYANPHISDVEQSYGPVHINLKAGRINPNTGQAFTKEGALDIPTAVQYALDEYRRTGGLGMWNPINRQPNPFYQYDIPERAKTKKFIKGK